MSAGVYDILIEQGAIFELWLTIQDSDGNPIDLTSATFDGEVGSGATHICNFSFTINSDQVNYKGQVYCYIPSTVTSAIVIPPADDCCNSSLCAQYEIGYQFTAGKRYRELMGTSTISAAVPS